MSSTVMKLFSFYCNIYLNTLYYLLGLCSTATPLYCMFSNVATELAVVFIRVY